MTTPRLSDQSCRRLYGIFVRKERWGLSWQAWLIILVGILLTFLFVFFHAYPFLAVTHRLNTNVLVVEGWIHDYAIRAAVEEFRTHAYERIYTTGGPVEGNGGYVNDYQTEASVGAELLSAEGIPNASLQMVPSRVTSRDRTYGAAVALRNWFHEHSIPVQSINVLTEDVHARRTRLLFQEALGRGVKVGVISVPNPDYDSKHWWRYSEGVKDVCAETVGYLYAEFLFYPSNASKVPMQDHR